MKSLRNISIRSKFLLAVIITVVTALFIALISIATLSYQFSSREFTDQLNVLVDITAERSQVALVFKDKRTVTQNIESLSKLTSIDLACVYNVKNNLFGYYERTSDMRCPKKLPDKLLLSERTLSPPLASLVIEKITNIFSHGADFNVAKKLFAKNRYIGTLYVVANASDVNRRLSEFLFYAVLIIIITTIIAYLLAYRLQFALTVPIIKLSYLAKEIGRTKDFSLRATVCNEDEAGSLAKSFNDLIHNIQESNMKMEELVLELQEKTKQLESHSEIVEGRNKSIKNWFSGASHDIKQPLQAMVLFVNALLMTSNPTQKVLLGKLDQAINNMRTLFEDLLDVSKLENLLDNFETSPVDLKPIIDNLFHEFEVLAADKSLVLKFHDRDFVVNSNMRMLERIIRNLLSNAIRYTKDGGVLIACRKRDGYACIEVWDTGIGIPKESLERIFKRFHQVEQKSDDIQGYGLGLSIVKRLSEKLKHPIEIKSILGKGTLFRVRIPMDDSPKLTNVESVNTGSDSSSSKLPQGSLSQVSHVILPGDKLNVILIDDDPLVLDSLKILLMGWGMHVAYFGSITQMTSYLEGCDERCDVIVSDFQLSETENGLDAISTVREYLGLQIPGLIVSATEDPELIQTIKESGIRRLKKPIKPAKLRALINHLHTNSISETKS